MTGEAKAKRDLKVQPEQKFEYLNLQKSSVYDSTHHDWIKSSHVTVGSTALSDLPHCRESGSTPFKYNVLQLISSFH